MNGIARGKIAGGVFDILGRIGGGVGARIWIAAAAVVLAAVAGEPTWAQSGELVPTAISPSESAARAMMQPFLTPEEKKTLRVFHGVWDERDLDTPERVGMAAMETWVGLEAAIEDEAVPAAMRAEMALQRGLAQRAMELVADDVTIRAGRIRAEALAMLNRADEAAAEAERSAGLVDPNNSESAADLVDWVRCREVEWMFRSPPDGEYDRMIGVLGRAGSQVDRLYWPAKRTEGRLLFSKSNREEAVAALHETLALNPRCAEAWYLLGRVALDVFDFESASAAAEAIGRLNAAHPLATLLRTESALVQNDPELARRTLDPLLRRESSKREVLAMDAAVCAVFYDETAVDAAIERFDAVSPGSPMAIYEAGRFLSSQRQYSWAATLLNKAIERRPAWADPWIELGLLEMQAARDTEARTALEKALALDRYNKRAVNSMFLLEELEKFKSIESKHFIIRYQPGVDEVTARLMPDALDAMHEIVASRFHHEPDRKTVIELMPDHQFFSVRITGMPWIHTVAACTGPLIALEVPKDGPPQKHLGPYDWLRVLQHEYTHTITLSQTRNRIPHWLTEAAAVSMEPGPTDYNTCVMLARELKTGGLFTLDTINWGFIRPQRPIDRGLAYAQGHWMVEFMNQRFGEEALVRLMGEYYRGERESKAMEHVLGVSRDDFMNEFLPWAAEQVKSWGLAATPSIDELTDELREKDPVLSVLSRRLKEEWLTAISMALAEQIGAPGDGRTKPLARADWPILKKPPVRIDDETLEEWIGRYPDHPDLAEIKVRRVMNNSPNDPTVAPMLERYATLRPVDPYPHRMLAQLYLAAGRDEEAVPHLEYLDIRADKDDSLTLELARIHRAGGRYEPALEAVTKAVRINPYSAANRELAAAIAVEANRLEIAHEHILALTILEPDRPRHHKRLEAVEKLMGGG